MSRIGRETSAGEGWSGNDGDEEMRVMGGYGACLLTNRSRSI